MRKKVDRDQNGKKRTQKGALHRQNPPKQPNRPLLTNHERHYMRRLQREAQ